MELTKDQQLGLKMAERLVKAPSHCVGVLAGWAGTGKTTLLKTIAEQLGTPMVICPTGKAAARVKEAAGLGASTAHRWMYQSMTDPKTGFLSFTRRPHDDLDKGESGLLVCEEASMYSRDLWGDIVDNARLLGLKVLCIGDNFQLPPVEDERTGFSCLDPDSVGACEYVQMTEVLRQAQESTVIRASMLIRDGDIQGALELLPCVPGPKFIEKGAQIQGRGGVVLCHRNLTRHWLNGKIRGALGLPADMIRSGEPVLVLKNNYQLGTMNGQIYNFVDWVEETPSRHAIYDRWSKVRESSRFGVARLQDQDKGEFRAVIAQEELLGRLKAGTAAIDQTANILYKDLPVMHATLGYCLSVHKAQGGEWPEVLVTLEPSIRFNGKDRDQSLRWAYTAITRSQEHCYYSLGVAAPPES